MVGGNNDGMTEEKAAVAYSETSKASEKKKELSQWHGSSISPLSLG